MGFLIHFFWGCLCSFFGTLPFGSINVSIAESAIHRGLRAGIAMGIGASVVEFFQAYIALSFFNILSTNPKMEKSIIVICIPIFLVIGFYFFFKKNGIPQGPAKKTVHAIGVAKGVMLSALNLIAIPYYVFIGGYLHSANYISLKPELIASFALGVVAGSFLVFLLYAKLGQYIRQKSEKLSLYASKIVGMIFVALAISQAIRYYW